MESAALLLGSFVIFLILNVPIGIIGLAVWFSHPKSEVTTLRYQRNVCSVP